MKNLPTIDMVKTGEKIESLRRASGFTVSELQEYLGFNTPQSCDTFISEKLMH